MTSNPFNVTKAVDFDDRQIRDYWVDLPGGAGFHELIKPTSPMPMIILGGKGSGKTHILRYFSYQLQRLRYNDIDGIRTEGYLGIYLRCGGLNASRFKGKGQEPEAWAGLFQQYMDLWLAQLFLETMIDCLPPQAIAKNERQVSAEIRALLDIGGGIASGSLAATVASLRHWQRELDVAINNAALTRQLSTEIRVTPGRLVFGLPKIFVASYQVLQGLQIVYLIDELENLDEQQQKYINTLIREKEAPCSFKIGARLYGVRTYATYSAGEINREGSEYEKLHLDDHLRSNRRYSDFAVRLCHRRLIEGGYLPETRASAGGREVRSVLRAFFEEPPDPLLAPDRFLVRTPVRQEAKPYFSKLATKLSEGLRLGLAPGLAREDDVGVVVQTITVEGNVFLEKVNCFLLYRDWKDAKDLVTAAGAIRSACDSYRQNPKVRSLYKETVLHFGSDLYAQLLADYGMKQQYYGFDTFVEMSRGLPRNFLVLLKHVFQWALFNGEQPFRGSPISLASQQQGVLEASRWFFRDAEVLGEDGPDIQNSIRRLADLFRAIRFADKPAECSLCTFSANLSNVSERSLHLIDMAEKSSLLIRIGGGQRDRNTGRLNAKFQLNSMLGPIWDLPIYRRGAIGLTPREVDAIFDPERASDYETIVRSRVSRMTAPHFGREGVGASGNLLSLLP